MRIAFLNPSGNMGGAERVLLDLVRGLQALHPEWQLYVIVTGEGELSRELADAGVRCDVLPFPASLARLGDAHVSSEKFAAARMGSLLLAAPATISYVARVRRLLREYAPDIVHTNGLKMHAIGALTKPPGSKLVWHMHDFVSSRRVMAPTLRYLSRRCSLGIANSNSVADDLRKVCRDRLPVTTILNAVNLASFRPDGSRLDLDSLCIPVERARQVVRVGLVASMAPWKGHAVFLRAIASIDRNLSIRAYVIGGPIYETATDQRTLEGLKKLADSLGISDRVCFTGFVDDIPAAMRALDIVVHASTAPEPFGLVITEAMASGRPVIVSALGGAAEIVEGGEFALSAAPGDVAALSRQIVTLAGDPALRDSMGKEGRREAERRFDSRSFTRAFATAYQSVNAGRA